MDPEIGVILITLLLFIDISSAYGQLRVDCSSQPYIPTSSPLISSGSIIHVAPQILVPNLDKPIVYSAKNYPRDNTAPIVPNLNSNGGLLGMGPGMSSLPPIIIDASDDDDDWQNLLYLLILAMKDHNNGCGGCCNNCHNGGGGCSHGCSCNFCGHNKCSECGHCSGCCNCGHSSDGTEHHGKRCEHCGASCNHSCGCHKHNGSGINGTNDSVTNVNNGCISYVPYPIPILIPGLPYFGGYGDDNNSGSGQADDNGSANEINLIIKTDSSNS